MSEGAAECWAREALAALSARGLERTLEPLERTGAVAVEADGRRWLQFASNDYLGLASHPALAEAGCRALRAHGAGSGGSRLVTGDHAWHHAVEEAAATVLRAPASLLFNGGYAANTGLLPLLAGEGDAIFSDSLNHASIVDGCRLSRARVVVYPHGDAHALEGRLANTPARRKVVVTEAVFSMDGDPAPLRDVVEACERHGAALVVDEAHAFGVLGPGGAGLTAALGLESRVDVRMATLGKAAGAAGAVVAGSHAVVTWLASEARSFLFTTALPPAVCAMAAEGLARLHAGDDLRAALSSNVARFADGLRTLGHPAPQDGPIVPLVLGTPERAVAAMRSLREHGIYVRAIRPPTVPEGTSRLRFSLTAAHTPAHVDYVLDALARCGIVG